MKRARRTQLLLFVGVFVVVSCLCYVSVDNANRRRKETVDRVLGNMQQVDRKLDDLETALDRNDVLIKSVKQKIDHKEAPVIEPNPVIKEPAIEKASKAPEPPFVQEKSDNNVCPLAIERQTPQSKVQMLDAYKQIPFDNIDGGKWKQGWDITYTEAQVAQVKLQVVVVPHSHCDPGWLMTFEEYYKRQVKNILDGMVKYLGEFDTMRFIYAEMSFFERWWKDQAPRTRALVKDYLKQNRLEIVTGAWVMTDEANTHYFNMIDQLIEGHEFLRQELDYRPQSHWSIDPFGLSSTMPHILKSANFSQMAIQRVHYSVKKYLASKKQLEFKWRQLWAASHENTDMLTHMFPFYSYDVPHTCGPDPAVCCQFDFRRMRGGGFYCPWGQSPQTTTEQNVAERAKLLVDQYRKKSQLYDTNVLLVPLGDDFRYDTASEWQVQHDNYKKLFEYINADKSLNTNARFGTLSDYFDLLKPQLTDPPTLSGDFFTYADRDDHYWSGYFTSRPHYKRMDRQLMHSLRSAEQALAHVLATSSTPPKFIDDLRAKLTDARRQLAIFQHHDGITGTAKDPVVNDYADRMMRALNECREVIAVSAEYIMTSDQGVKDKFSGTSTTFKATTVRPSIDDLDVESVVPQEAGKKRHFVVQNAMSIDRTDVHCIHTASPNVAVKQQEKLLKVQVEPVFRLRDGSMTVAPNEFKVCFGLTTNALSFTSLELLHLDKFDDQNAKMASIHLDSSKLSLPSEHAFDVKALNVEQQYQLQNEHVSAMLNARDGYLKTVNNQKMQLHFVRYGARRPGSGKTKGADNPPGAYLFLPDGPARPVDSANDGHQVIYIKGPVVSRWQVAVGKLVDHTLSLCHDSSMLCSRSIAIENIADIKTTHDFELAMRLDTDIDSKNTFYTDLNSFQMLRRERFDDKLPIQANVYPMTSAALLDDGKTRLTLLSAQPGGGASHSPGSLEVMLDRRLSQDDGRGVGQGVVDNRPTQSLLAIVLQNVDAELGPDAKAAFHTKLAHATSLSMNHPVNSIYSTTDSREELESSMSIVTEQLPCDTELLNLRVRETSTAMLLLHRTITQCNKDDQTLPLKCQQAKQVSPQHFVKGIGFVDQLTLSGMYKLPKTQNIDIQPMDLLNFEVKLGI